MELLYQQIERLESELSNLKKQNQNLEHQLSSYCAQYNDLEADFHRTKADTELETATLNHNLKCKEKILINAIAACNKVKKDIDGVQDQLKEIPMTVDWNKLKDHEDGLSEFIELCRYYIIEMAKELSNLQKQLCAKDQEILMIFERNEKLQDNLRNSTTEITNLVKKIDDSDKILAEHRCKCLEADLKLKTEELKRLKFDFEEEKSGLSNKVADLERLNTEKVSIIEQSNIYINNLNSDNLNLRNQINNLNRLLRDTGSGDILKEINMKHEQIHKLDFQCNQLIGEKQQLLQQLEFLREDHNKNSQIQLTNNQKLEKLQTDLENLVKENRQLQQKYESERHTLISLQTERKKYLDEKALIKTFFHHMKAEINRLQKLEGTVTDISKEANKLALVAEYNKQLGKKLKSEIEEKDKTIVKLQSSVEQLNDIHVKTTKEKLTLCSELTELCQMKEKLNNDLSYEVQRCMALDDAKKEIAETAQCQLMEYEEFQRRERTVLNDLLKDLKCVVKQRNNILEEKQSLAQQVELLNKTKEQQTHQMEDQEKKIDQMKKQIEELDNEIQGQHKKNDDLIKKNEDLKRGKQKLEERVDRIDEEQEKDKANINRLQDRLVFELQHYDGNVKEMEKLVFELRKEKGNMEDSIKYLQKNTQKLHDDLNESRGNETEMKVCLNKITAQKNSLDDELKLKNRELESLALEKEKLMNEVNQVNLVCEKVLTDLEANITSSMKKEELFKKELNESQNALMKTTKENDRLSMELISIKEEYDKINYEFNRLKDQEYKFTDLIQSLETKKAAFKDLLNQKEKLEHDIFDLKHEYKIAKEELLTARQECDSLFRQMKIAVDQKKQEIFNHQKEIEDVVKENTNEQIKKDKEINELKSMISDLNKKIDNERSSYTSLSQIHKDISTKMIRSIKDIVDEKNGRQEAERKLKEFKESVEKLKNDKAALQQERNELLDELKATKSHLNVLNHERESSQYLISELQMKYKETMNQCINLEDQIRGSQAGTDSDFEDIKMLQTENDKMKKDLEESHKMILSLQKEVGDLQQQVTALEFLKSENTLRLHEIHRKFETEQNLCRQLKNIQKIVLSEIFKMKDAGVMDQEHSNCLVNLIKNNSSDIEDVEVF